MRLDETAFLPRFASGVQNWASALVRQLQLYLQRTAQQVNLISEGRMAGQTNALEAAPTTGKWAIGDVVRNSNCTATGSDAIYGWLCVASGEPGSWVEIHCANSGTGGSGTVTSIAQTVPVEFSVSGSPVTTSGTLAISKSTQNANYVWAGPTSGAAAQPTFRALVAADLPVTGAYWNFGTGEDGDAVFNGSNTFSFASKSGNDYTLTRAVLLDDCTISSGCTLDTAGFPFYVNGTLTVTGTLHCDGKNATTSTGGAAGGGGYYGAGGNGHTTNAAQSTTNAYGGNGGTGGRSSENLYDNGQATATAPIDAYGGLANKAALTVFYTGYTVYASGSASYQIRGGAGGMGGESTAANPNNQGVGGGGGGVLHIAARYIAGAGTISAKGGNAYNADTNDCGGGGGGGGGVIMCMTRTVDWQAGRTVSVAGGSKGTGYADGTDGSAGTIVEWIV